MRARHLSNFSQRHVALFAAWCWLATIAAADADAPTTSVSAAQAPLSKAGWTRAAWGTAPADGVFYMPGGLHHNSQRVRNFGLVGGIYKSAYATTFTNSYGDRTWSLGFQRDVSRLGPVHVGYGLGLMYGYHGRLSESQRFPLQDTFLFRGDFNPVVGVPLHVDLSSRVQLEAFVTPLVTLFGVKIRRP
ncbi:MAG: hypothetical protein ABL961_02845 [Vicinamibacterales bacterium]